MAMSDSPGGSRHSFCPYWLPWRLHINQFTVVFFLNYLFISFFFLSWKTIEQNVFPVRGPFLVNNTRHTHTKHWRMSFLFLPTTNLFFNWFNCFFFFSFFQWLTHKTLICRQFSFIIFLSCGGDGHQLSHEASTTHFFLTNGGNTKTLDIINTRTPTLSTKFHNLKLSIKWRPGDLAVNVRPSTGNHGAQLKKIWTEHWNKTQQGRRKLRGSFRED
jgi:hypothetical protein